MLRKLRTKVFIYFSHAAITSPDPAILVYTGKTNAFHVLFYNTQASELSKHITILRVFLAVAVKSKYGKLNNLARYQVAHPLEWGKRGSKSPRFISSLNASVGIQKP